MVVSTRKALQSPSMVPEPLYGKEQEEGSLEPLYGSEHEEGSPEPLYGSRAPLW
jgi:hypothetical protein